jgi:hypothetical protein
MTEDSPLHPVYTFVLFGMNFMEGAGSGLVTLVGPPSKPLLIIASVDMLLDTCGRNHYAKSGLRLMRRKETSCWWEDVREGSLPMCKMQI